MRRRSVSGLPTIHSEDVLIRFNANRLADFEVQKTLETGKDPGSMAWRERVSPD